METVPKQELEKVNINQKVNLNIRTNVITEFQLTAWELLSTITEILEVP